MMHDCFRAIVDNPDRETVILGPSRWGMCIRRRTR
jgi:hypothetical protein